MDSMRWERVQALFHAAAGMPRAEQMTFLAAQCADDPTLVDETLSLLEADATAVAVLDQGVAPLASRVLGRASDEPLPSGFFGQYRVTRMLGEGGMGVVYLATRDDLGSLAAVKILRDASLSPSRRERFASEQRTLAQLNHPNVARLYDAGTLPDGTPWIVMEYVEGVPLTEYCENHAANLASRLHLFHDVCEAVQHAHRQLVIHRDLKPSNVLVTADGAVKLLDFGIAKQLEHTEAAADQTRTGLRLMTPAYAAPEQRRGGRVGTYTDVYSLGVILYELVTGRLPFGAFDSEESDAVGANREAERPSTAVRKGDTSTQGVGASAATRSEWTDLDVLCLTAMHADPQRRYSSVDALMRDVEHYLRGEPLEARPDSVRYRLGKFVRRNREAVVATGVSLALVVGLVAFYTVRLAGARNEALSEAARAQRIQRFTLGLFQGDDEIAGPADSLRVITLVDRGLQEAQALRAEPGVEADLDLTLASIYQRLGNFARADSLMQAALSARRARFGQSHPDVADALVALGQLRTEQARFDEAERLIRDGLEMERRTLPPYHPALVKAMVALGNTLQAKGTYDTAIPVLQEAVQLNATHGSPADLAMSISALADAHFYVGHYEVSDSLNQRALPIYRQLYGDRHPRIADVLLNLAATQYERGNYANAERFDRQALDMTRGFYGKDSHQTADNMTLLGRVLVRENKLDEAAALLGDALAIRERVYGRVHPSVASTLNELGQVAVRRDRLDEAEQRFRRMLDIYHAVYGDHHFLIGVATSNLGGVYLARRRYATAESLFRDAVRRFASTQGVEHLNTGIARFKLGRTLLAERRFADAADESLAAYEIIGKHASASNTFLQSARGDLVAEYDSLGQPDKAARFREPAARTR